MKNTKDVKSGKLWYNITFNQSEITNSLKVLGSNVTETAFQNAFLDARKLVANYGGLGVPKRHFSNTTFSSLS